MPKNVIIGGGPAGISAIETIRQFDRSSPITLISNEASYSRTALPDSLAKRFDGTQLYIGSDKSFRRLDVVRRQGRVIRIAAKKKQVELEGGGSVAYDNLLIATGASPQRPPIAGASGKHVHTLWTIADARALMASADMKRPSVVVVGAGFIGLTIVNALHKLGWTISLVEMSSQILPRTLDRHAADAVHAWLCERGVQVHTGVTVTSIAGGRRKTVALSDGRQLTSHIVVLSTGSAPNVGFLKGSGVKVDKGIIVDKHMRTNVAGIYAAGDVAQGPGLLGGPKTIHPIQTTAVEHGRIAGANMAGQESVFAGSLMTSILDVAGLHCASIGRWKDKDDVTEVWDAENRVYRKLVWDADRLIGGIILGPAGNASLRADTETLIELVRSRVQLGSGKRELQEDPSNLRRLRDTSAAEPNRQRRRPSERISRRRATATG